MNFDQKLISLWLQLFFQCIWHPRKKKGWITVLCSMWATVETRLAFSVVHWGTQVSRSSSSLSWVPHGSFLILGAFHLQDPSDFKTPLSLSPSCLGAFSASATGPSAAGFGPTICIPAGQRLGVFELRAFCPGIPLWGWRKPKVKIT